MMNHYGRHKVYLIFWPWDYEPITVTDDIANFMVSKSCGSGQTARFSLYPRWVPYRASDGRMQRREGVSYMDVLKPNTWVFAIVDKQDGTPIQPLFMGFIDRCFIRKQISRSLNRSIEVSATGWEKVVQNTNLISDAWISEGINISTLLALGPMGNSGARSDDETSGQAVGGIYQREIADAVNFILEVFLTTDPNRAKQSLDAVLDNQAQQTRDILLGLTDDAARDALYDEIPGVSEEHNDDTPELEPTNPNSQTVQPIMGQFELPNTGNPFWDFLKVKIENLPYRIFIDPRMFANNTVTSLDQMLDSMANVVTNALIYDVRNIGSDGLSDLDERLYREAEGGYSADAIQSVTESVEEANTNLASVLRNIAPYVILRERPLFEKELLALDGPIMDESEFITVDLGISDADLHNITSLEMPNVNFTAMRTQAGYTGFTNYRERSIDSIRRHGLRHYKDQVIAWPSDSSTPQPGQRTIYRFEDRLHKAGLDEVELWNGSVSAPKYMDGLFLGGKLVINHPASHGIAPSAQSRVYYVDSLDYSYSANDGSFSTSIGLTRGYKVTKRATGGVPIERR